jgi:hypothetical protein
MIDENFKKLQANIFDPKPDWRKFLLIIAAVLLIVTTTLVVLL